MRTRVRVRVRIRVTSTISNRPLKAAKCIGVQPTLGSELGIGLGLGWVRLDQLGFGTVSISNIRLGHSFYENLMFGLGFVRLGLYTTGSSSLRTVWKCSHRPQTPS
eukprot:997559-Amorphochlora_amoeboformis.AAC.1